MKISHRLFILVFICGFGYLGITVAFNKLYRESMEKGVALGEIQSLINGLNLVALEINFNTTGNQTKAIETFTLSAAEKLQLIRESLPRPLADEANKIATDLANFNATYQKNQSSEKNLDILIKHFKINAKNLNKTIYKQCKLLERQINDPTMQRWYLDLQEIDNLVSRYSSLTIENLLIENNIPSFKANRYFITQKIDERLKKSPTSAGDFTNMLGNELRSWTELSQRIAAELSQQNNTQLKLNIIEENTTKALIKLEADLKQHIDASINTLNDTYQKATFILLFLTLGASILISRSIFSPLEKLVSFSKELARGNYTAKLSGLPNEFQEISLAFNQMTGKIKHASFNLERQVEERTHQLAESNEVLKKEIAERQHVEQILKEVASTVLTRKGEQYFSSFTHYLTKNMGYDFAFIGQLGEQDGVQTITTLSFTEKGKELPNITYPTKDTPCELVAANKRLFFPGSIQSLFPDAQFLINEGIESYVGAPVLDQNGKPLGLVSVLNRSPIESAEPVLPILQILVSQVGAEIERSQQDMALKFSEERNRVLVDNAPEAIVILNLETGKFCSANQHAIELFGYSHEQLLTKRPADVSPEFQPNGLPSAEIAIAKVTSAVRGNCPAFEWVHQNAQGRLVECEIRLNVFPSETEQLVRGSITDISERKQSEKQMKKLSHALEQTADAVMVTDTDGIIEYVNHATEDITGFSKDELLGENTRILKSGQMDQSFYQNLWKTLISGNTYRDIFINKRKDGVIYYEEKTISPLIDEAGNIKNYVSTGKDITDRIQTEKRLHHLAYHDPLTDLPNRLMLVERLEHAIDNADRREMKLGVMFLDLDRFKNINDTLGHNVGDSLLKEISQRILSLLRANDTVARLGGDEFAILIEWPENSQELASIAEKIIDSFKRPFSIQGHELFTSTSIGISFYPNNGKDSETLLKNADVAMYRAKEQGRDCYQFYSTDLTAKAYKRLSIENKLRKALDNQEFELFYQPQVLRPTNIVYGLEALLRWRDPEKGLISPVDFIPILEETGMIIPVGEWVLEQACKDLQEWQSQSPIPLIISVNLSSKQFEDQQLGDKILDIIAKNNYDPRLLELEITESALMIDPKQSVALLKQLSESGIRFAVDDFGTGYSSLSYLKQFPIHTLKIDRSFVQDITVDRDDAAIVSAVTALARSLSLDVIAEGVETLAQVKFLEQYQCYKIQGFLYSKPLPKDQCFKFLQENQGIIEHN